MNIYYNNNTIFILLIISFDRKRLIHFNVVR